jgi:hypothetical protein
MLQMVWRSFIRQSEFPLLVFWFFKVLLSGQEIYVYGYFKKTDEGKRQS